MIAVVSWLVFTRSLIHRRSKRHKQ